MKYPGQPKESPYWYRDREPSFIEDKFINALGDMAELIEKEHWFGDENKHSRYRVDFILKDARLIIELDGHDFHSSQEQLENDAVRQRYLTRAGYSVIRFTGREVYKNPAACVTELRNTYKERMQRAPSKYRAMYIDYQFLVRQMSEALRFYRDLHPNKSLRRPSLEEFIPHAIDWLHEKSFITAFVFIPPEEKDELDHLDGTIKDYEKGEIRINIIPDEMYTIELGEHLVNFSHLFDDFYLIADDPVYIVPLRSVLPNELSEEQIGKHFFPYLPGGKLLRKDNDRTAYVETDLAHVRWQDVWYPIAASIGLDLHEL